MRPPQVTDLRLQRTAIVYLRQSSNEQVKKNVGSTAVQRDLPEMLKEWGWSPERIAIIDNDLGFSGSIPGHREGFARLLEQMGTGRVGLVVVTEASRLARNLQDFAAFDEAARHHDVLFAVGSQIYDLRDPNVAFISTIFGANAARENRARVEMSKKARLKKAQAGIATTHPPIGYIRVGGGSWIKDPDPRVQDAIELVFDKYRELGSGGAVVRFLRRSGIRLPGRIQSNGRSWPAATKSAVFAILTHPAYAGIYEYGRTEISEPATAGRRARRRDPTRTRPPLVSFKDHHEPYVQPALRDQILHRLASAKRTLQGPAGRGEALVQGLLRCRIHETKFKTRYPYRRRRTDGSVKRVGQYWCMRDETGWAEVCCELRSERIDVLVETEILRTLVPPSLDVLEEASREALRAYHVQQRGREDDLRRADQAVDQAERALDQTDLGQVHLRKRFSEGLERALQQREELRLSQAARPLHPPLELDDSDLAELRGLLGDLPGLWHHPNVTAEQRKAVVRRVIKAVYATPRSDEWTVEIEWVSGARTSFELFTSKGVRSLVWQACGAGQSIPEITELLRKEGVVHRTGVAAGEPYTKFQVSKLIWRMRRKLG
jgi:DNA invertase Pin-like site-specific DNA recombinase